MRNATYVFLLVGLMGGLNATYGWTRTYGSKDSESGTCVAQTADGGYIVLGVTEYPAWWHVNLLLIKTDAHGDTQWMRIYDIDTTDYGHGVKEIPNNGYMVLGYRGFGGGYTDLWLVGIDLQGDTLWTRSYGAYNQSMGLWMENARDGHFIVTGVGCLRPSVFGDLWLLKINERGDTLWSRSYGSWDEYGQGQSVASTSDGGYIVSGLWDRVNTPGGSSQCLFKTDSLGDTLWTRTFEYNAGIRSVVLQSNDSGYLLMMNGLRLVKTDSLGNLRWSRTYPYKYGNTIVHGHGGGYIVAGSYDGDLWLMKVDEFGNRIWSRTYGGAGSDGAMYMDHTSDGGYIIVGSTSSFGSGRSDIWLLKADENGDTTYSALAEQPVPVTPVTQYDFVITNPIGREIVLKYTEYPQGFHAAVYEASGRRVDEIYTPNQSGVLVWGSRQNPGVYFIRDVVDRSVHKVVLVK